MLFEIMFLLSCLALPIMTIVGYNTGLSHGRQSEGAPIVKQVKKKSKERVKLENQTEILLKNIENFDGTGKNQTEILLKNIENFDGTGKNQIEIKQ